MNSSSVLSDQVSRVSSDRHTSVLNPGFGSADPSILRPHPQNSAIYGEDEDVSSLVDMIQASGWVKPLVVTPTGTIISGHRHWKAVLALGWESVPQEVREFPDSLAELEALLLENASRFKNVEQKVREAEAWKEIETFHAQQRKLSNLKQGNSRPEVENFPPREETGKTRDRIASRVGLGSGRTYAKAANVVTQIDEEANQGHKEIAQALRKVLNEQSVDAAQRLLKKSPQERHAIARLIVSGEAKSIKQALRMVKQNNSAEFNDPSATTLAGFSTGDWVTINDNAQSKTYIGLKGQVEQILAFESQISVNLKVNFEDGPDKVRFYPHELTLIAKAPPPCPYKVGDIVFVDIDRFEAADAQQKKWSGFWGKVTLIGEMGSLRVDVGCESLQLFPRDLKPIDAPSKELLQVAERILRLRRLELDEIELRMLDVLQRREWFTPNQLIHLGNIEQLYLHTDFFDTDKHQVTPMPGHLPLFSN